MALTLGWIEYEKIPKFTNNSDCDTDTERADSSENKNYVRTINLQSNFRVTLHFGGWTMPLYFSIDRVSPKIFIAKY